jgi:hypothetical protein
MEDEQRKEEIEKIRSDDVSLRPKPRREAEEKRRKIDELTRCVLRAIKTGDDRSLAKQLRQAGYAEGSDEWNRIWEIFRASLRPK